MGAKGYRRWKTKTVCVAYSEKASKQTNGAASAFKMFVFKALSTVKSSQGMAENNLHTTHPIGDGYPESEEVTQGRQEILSSIPSSRLNGGHGCAPVTQALGRWTQEDPWGLLELTG